MSRTASRMSIIQYGALPWRRTPEGALQVLLITTRGTRRWIVPKGWADEGRDPREAAAIEAYEEAGVLGDVYAEPLGMFVHRKLLKSGQTVACRIHVFPMEVIEVCDDWAEKGEREAKWCSIDEALALVPDSGLRRIIVKFFREASSTADAA